MLGFFVGVGMELAEVEPAKTADNLQVAPGNPVQLNTSYISQSKYRGVAEKEGVGGWGGVGDGGRGMLIIDLYLTRI